MLYEQYTLNEKENWYSCILQLMIAMKEKLNRNYANNILNITRN